MLPLTRIAKFLFHDPRLFFRYISAGAVAALIELALFTSLYQFAGWSLLSANCTALAIAVVICFILQKHWTFQVPGESKRQFKLYILMQAISAILNNLLMLTLVGGFSLYAPLAKVVQIGIVFLWNYSFCRLVVFAKRDRFAPPE